MMPLDANQPTNHIRCGSDIFTALAEAGFVGKCLEFSDPYCIGPVKDEPDLPALRAAWLANAFGIEPQALLAKLGAQYRALRELPSDVRIVLWFEHDSYDQLILARLLAHFAVTPRSAPVELICIADHPEVPRFIGLGQLSPDQLRALWPQRVTVNATHYALGTRVWAALQSPDPRELQACTDATLAVPAMANALRRHLQELPWTDDGLSLTQRLSLRALCDGPMTRHQLFGVVQQTEPLPFLGDMMFDAVVRELTLGVAPAIGIQGDDCVLTDIGRALLAGQADWIRHIAATRWVGGVRVAPHEAGWRWSTQGVMFVD